MTELERIQAAAEDTCRRAHGWLDKPTEQWERAKCAQYQVEIDCITATIYAAVVEERERCAQIAFGVGYNLAAQPAVRIYNEYDNDLIVKAAEQIAAAIRRGD